MYGMLVEIKEHVFLKIYLGHLNIYLLERYCYVSFKHL